MGRSAGLYNGFGIAAAVILLTCSLSDRTLAQSCSKTDIGKAAAQLEAARKTLLALPIGDGHQTDVSPAGMSAIATMKDRLNAFVTAYIRCAPETIDARSIKDDLDRLGHARTMENRVYRNSEIPPDSYNYGYQLSFDATRPRSPADLLAITANFQIECGGDTVLMVFDHRGNSWMEVLRLQGKPYKTVGGGWNSFDYAVSPPDAGGNWFVVTKTVAPWCSSTWSAIDYSVIRRGPNPSQPREIFHREDSIWWGNEDFGRLKVGRNDFDLRFHAESMDAAVHNREWIRRYAVNGDTVRRIPPVADFPRDFVDEWIISDWKDAEQWTLPSVAARLRMIHAEVHKNGGLEYDSFHTCLDGVNRFQIAAGSDEATGLNGYYFLVSGNGDFQMLDVTRHANQNCNRPDAVDPPMLQ